MNLSDRIKLARTRAKLTQSQLAEAVGIAQTAISQLESGKTLRSSYLIQIAKACGVNSQWLQSGEGQVDAPEDDDALISAWIKEVVSGEHPDDAALHGALRERIGINMRASKITPSNSVLSLKIPYLIELEDPKDKARTTVQVSKSTFVTLNEEILWKQDIPPASVVAVAVVGNSMSPVLNDGATVLVHQGDDSVVDGKMYVLAHAGQIRVKSLYRLPGGGIRARSYNLVEHPDETYTLNQMDEDGIKIIGRVFWGASFF